MLINLHHSRRGISIGLKAVLLNFCINNKQVFYDEIQRISVFFLLSENKLAERLGVILVSVCINISTFILIQLLNLNSGSNFSIKRMKTFFFNSVVYFCYYHYH